MTDREKLIALLDEWGVGYNSPDDGLDEQVNGNDITLQAKVDDKVAGYSGFFAVFSFAEDGSFKDIGVWE